MYNRTRIKSFNYNFCFSTATMFVFSLLQAPLCNSNNSAPLSSAMLAPPPPPCETTNASSGHSSSIRQNGVSRDHMSVLDSSVFMKDMNSKQLPANIKFYEFYNAPITKFWAHSVWSVFTWLFSWCIINQ